MTTGFLSATALSSLRSIIQIGVKPYPSNLTTTLRRVRTPSAPSSEEVWQSLREYRAGIPERRARWKRAAQASQESLAQVEQHKPSSCDIKLDLTVALSYETDINLEHRGERNVPKRYLKEARWDAHNEPDGTINLGYFAQDREGNYIPVDFDFNTLTWGTTHRTRKGKYRLTIPAPIELGLRIVDEE